MCVELHLKGVGVATSMCCVQQNMPQHLSLTSKARGLDTGQPAHDVARSDVPTGPHGGGRATGWDSLIRALGWHGWPHGRPFGLQPATKVEEASPGQQHA